MNSKQNWACVGCGMSSSRKESVRRHIRTQHNDIGTIVSYTDYLVGRLSGNYAKAVAPPTYIKFSTRTEKLGTETKHRTTATTLFDNWKGGFYRELGAQLARKNFGFNKTPHPIMNPFSQSNQPFYRNPEEIFGLELYVCKKCLFTKPQQICFSKDSKDMGLTRIVPDCPPDSIMTKLKPISDESELIRTSSERFPVLLKELVKDLAHNGKIELVAIKISDVNTHSSNHCVKLALTDTNSNKTKSIGLPYSEEKSIELKFPEGKDEYIARAIKDHRTFLNDHELLDFFQKSSPSTFAFFKVKMPEKSITSIYLMAVIIAMNINNNAQIILSLDTQMAQNTVLDSRHQLQEQLPSIEQRKQDKKVFSNNSTDLFKKSQSPISETPKIIAYESYVCEKCLVNLDPIPIYTGKYQERVKIESLHRCSPELLSKCQELTSAGAEYKSKQLTHLYDKQLEVMKKKVKDWTKNQPYLLAIQSPNPLGINTKAAAVTDLNNAVRLAIKQSKTALSDEELSNFLRQSKGSTCMDIKVDFNVRKPLLTRQQSWHEQDKSSTPASCSPLIRYYTMGVLPLDLISPYTKELSLLSYVSENLQTPRVQDNLFSPDWKDNQLRS